MKRKIFILVCLILSAITFFSACTKESGKLNSRLDLNNKDKYESQSFSANEVDDNIYTTYQVSGYYDATKAVPTDSVMVYISQIDGVEGIVATYLNKGYKQVDMMIPNGRDMGRFYIDGGYDGQNHHDIVQKDKDGTWKLHTSGSYYVHPSEGFNDYLVDWCKKAIAAGVKDIYIEEPDGYIKDCFSDYFKSLWKQKYGVDFVYNEEDFEQTTKTNEIVAKMFVDSYDYVSTKIKETYPESNVYIATHSIAGYCGTIVANNAEMVSLPNIDGVIGQSWTNTSMQPIYYEGAKQTKFFENSYMEYSELVNYTVANGKKAYMLNDASADGGYTYDVTRPIWEHNIVAQMLMPDVYCFESTVWSERAFTNAPANYKAVQEGIYRLQGEIHSFESITYSGTNGIGVLTSYTGASSFIDMPNAFSSLVTPLISQGIPVDVITLENLTSQNALKNIDVLIMSYDFIKPNNVDNVKVLADWVKDGGVIIYVGGYNFSQTFSGQWKDEGFNSPQDQLFSKLGLTINSHEQFIGNKTLTANSKNPSYMSGTVAYSSLKTTFTKYDIGSDATPLYTADGEVIAFEQKSGDGNVIVCGVEPIGMSAFEGAYSQLYEKIIMRGIDLAGKQYYAPGAMYTVRGEYTFAHSISKEISLNGIYVDILSDDFNVIMNPVVKVGESAVYKKINAESGIIYSNGKISNFNENDSGMSFTIENVPLSKAQFLIKIPSGLSLNSIQAMFVKSGLEPSNFSVTGKEDGLVLISYSQNKQDAINITVNY